MIPAIALILLFQLMGEVISRALGLPLPGPVLGMVGLLVALVAIPALGQRVQDTAQGLLKHLSLLFVPAGVGVVAHLGVLSQAGPALALALVVSTIAAIAVGALVFVGVARLTGSRPE
jgi:holin-like protein